MTFWPVHCTAPCHIVKSASSHYRVMPCANYQIHLLEDPYCHLRKEQGINIFQYHSCKCAARSNVSNAVSLNAPYIAYPAAVIVEVPWPLLLVFLVMTIHLSPLRMNREGSLDEQAHPFRHRLTCFHFYCIAFTPFLVLLVCQIQKQCDAGVNFEIVPKLKKFSLPECFSTGINDSYPLFIYGQELILQEGSRVVCLNDINRKGKQCWSQKKTFTCELFAVMNLCFRKQKNCQFVPWHCWWVNPAYFIGSIDWVSQNPKRKLCQQNVFLWLNMTALQCLQHCVDPIQPTRAIVCVSFHNTVWLSS